MYDILLHLRNTLYAMPRKHKIISASATGGMILFALVVFYLVREFYPPPAQALVLRYDDVMTMTGFTITPEKGARGGNKLNVLLEWRAQKDIHARYVTQVQVVDARGHIWADHVDEPANGLGRTDRWANGQRVLDSHMLDLPSTMPSGNYNVMLAVYDPDFEWNLPVRNASGRMIFDQPVIADIQIDKDKSNVAESKLLIEQRLTVELGDLDFLGYIPNPAPRVSRGEPLHIGVYWRARNKPSTDYIVAIQLRDKGGSLIYEHAMRPAANTYPTTLWDQGEVLLDWHDFPVPISFSAGAYQIFVVLRDSNTGLAVGEIKIFDITVTR